MAVPRRFKGRFDRKGKNEHRVNHEIRIPEVRLVDDQGNQVGVVNTKEALRMAEEKGLDLMEVAPKSRPPVCKIVDYGKFKYEKKKKEQQAKKKQAVTKVKEVQLRPNTEEHDRQVKFKNARTFLEDGDRVKVSVIFKGRQIAHSELGYRVMDDLMEQVKDVGMVESKPRLEGKRLIMILAPVGKKSSKSGKEGQQQKNKQEESTQNTTAESSQAEGEAKEEPT